MGYAFPLDLRKRTFKFTCDAYDYCEELLRLPGLARRVGFQLFDAAASVGANLEEAKAAYSRKEFAAKNAISLKECRESSYWLKVAEVKRLGNNKECTILTSIVKKLQEN